jgi:(E)-4-hydroxy-3-methylbut-2-enyl-diphosphate synthase
MDGKVQGLSVPAGSVGWALQLLQAAGLRRSGTEIIACPSCGRSTFDLLEMASRVKSSVKGKKGLKIAVMGCIVNGPGEMEDADFGILGAGKGKVSIYARGKEVESNIPEDQAIEYLLSVIASSGE